MLEVTFTEKNRLPKHLDKIYPGVFLAKKMHSVLPSPLLGTFPSEYSRASSENYSLSDLIHDIQQHLGAISGINSSSVDEEFLKFLFQKYQSKSEDWLPYYHNDTSKSYTRNAVESINKKANIVCEPRFLCCTFTNLVVKLLLVWNPEKGSPIHDHANAHCIMKVLAGNLTETVYYPRDCQSSDTMPLKEKSVSNHGTNQVTYISDQIGLHRVSNPSANQIAVSLHCKLPLSCL